MNVITIEQHMRNFFNAEAASKGEAPLSDEDWESQKNEAPEDVRMILDSYKEFARMHVQAALKVASEMAVSLSEGPIKQELILTCYGGENDIK